MASTTFLSELAPYLECCKRVSLSKSGDGSVSVSATGLIGDMESLIDFVESNDFIKIMSNSQDGHLKTVVLAVKSESYGLKKIRRNMSFKSIPINIYEMYTNAINPKSILPPIAEPDLDIRIKQTDDWFGETGWTVSEIMNELGVGINLPVALDYHVYETSVKEGTPVIHFLRSLLPVPGLIISEHDSLFYVNMCTEDVVDPPMGEFCYLTGLNTQETQYLIVVEGLPSTPKNIEFLGDREMDLFQIFYKDGNIPYYYSPTNKEIDGTDTMKMKINLVGGIYGIASESFHRQDLSGYVEEMYRFVDF